MRIKHHISGLYKKILTPIGVLSFFVVGVFFVSYAINTWNSGYAVDYNATTPVTMTVYGGNNGTVCKKVTNNCGVGTGIFVPTSGYIEWDGPNGFIAKKPSCITVSDCITTPPVCNPTALLTGAKYPSFATDTSLPSLCSAGTPSFAGYVDPQNPIIFTTYNYGKASWDCNLNSQTVSCNRPLDGCMGSGSCWANARCEGYQTTNISSSYCAGSDFSCYSLESQNQNTCETKELCDPVGYQEYKVAFCDFADPVPSDSQCYDNYIFQKSYCKGQEQNTKETCEAAESLCVWKNPCTWSTTVYAAHPGQCITNATCYQTDAYDSRTVTPARCGTGKYEDNSICDTGKSCYYRQPSYSMGQTPVEGVPIIYSSSLSFSSVGLDRLWSLPDGSNERCSCVFGSWGRNFQSHSCQSLVAKPPGSLFKDGEICVTGTDNNVIVGWFDATKPECSVDPSPYSTLEKSNPLDYGSKITNYTNVPSQYPYKDITSYGYNPISAGTFNSNVYHYYGETGFDQTPLFVPRTTNGFVDQHLYQCQTYNQVSSTPNFFGR